MTVSGLDWLIGGSSNRSLLKPNAASCPFCRGLRHRTSSVWQRTSVSPLSLILLVFPPPQQPCESLETPRSKAWGWTSQFSPPPIILTPTPCVLHMAFGKIIKQKWNRLRNEHKRINSLELWLHNGNRLLWMNPCTEVMSGRVNVLPWVHLYYYITPESIDKVAFFFVSEGWHLIE